MQKNLRITKGFITQGFFCDNNFNRAKFISGPFTNLFFDILSNQSDKIEILMGKYKTTILKKIRIIIQARLICNMLSEIYKIKSR